MTMKPEIDKRELALAWMRTLGLHGPAWSEDDVKYFMRDEPAVDQIAAETNQVAAEKDFTFAEYGAQALMAAAYPGGTTIDALSYLALKLAGEAGEVAQKIAKAVRDNASISTRRGGLLCSTSAVIAFGTSMHLRAS
jgi:hypothetical protein